MSRGIQRYVGDVAEWLGRRVSSLPGVGAVVCAVLGVYLLTGRLGWALVTAVPFLIAIDRARL